jgi:hypothetical protein
MVASAWLIHLTEAGRVFLQVKPKIGSDLTLYRRACADTCCYETELRRSR